MLYINSGKGNKFRLMNVSSIELVYVCMNSTQISACNKNINSRELRFIEQKIKENL
jgi:hypothetical protein